MTERLEGYDWEEAFKVASRDGIQEAVPDSGVSTSRVVIELVKCVFASDEGENDESDWVVYGELHDGRFFSLRAGCDYTGWG